MMSELDMWNILAGFMSGNAVWFLAYVVATWLGFRMTSNIYMNGGAPIIGKILVSLYCLSVSAFMCTLMVNTNGLFRDVAAGLTTVGQTGELSGAAQAFIEQASNAPSMNPIQMVFVASIILMQLLQVWMKKPAGVAKLLKPAFGYGKTGGLAPFLTIKHRMPLDLAGKISCGLTEQCVNHIARNDRHQDHHEVAFQ